MDDERIVALYWERKENAIVESERKYGRYCRAIAYNILASHEDAQECVNDTWYDAWQAMPPERPTRLSSFLGRITRNIAIDRFRYDSAKKRGAEAECAIEEYWECIPNGDAAIDDELVLRQAINDFLKSLDIRSRVIFMRRYWYTMSVKDIATSMGMSESYVSVLLHRTRGKFKDYLTKEGILL